ncbi:putative uncharacterized protein [Streptomyces azureus]|uniref:Uncharacterized protein n=1 Tax=Streptomyces azureus TaxID=146537 RepID=A0A0K8PG26_STRAJ|nr:putative uncharacterized protein [Streptomyces azureus]
MPETTLPEALYRLVRSQMFSVWLRIETTPAAILGSGPVSRLTCVTLPSVVKLKETLESATVYRGSPRGLPAATSSPRTPQESAPCPRSSWGYSIARRPGV